MATTGIIQRRDNKANLIADPPLVGEIVFATDSKEFGTNIDGSTVWRDFSDTISSVNGYTGAVLLTKDDILLDQVDNTADIDKPVSTATNAAIIAAISGVPQSDWTETNTSDKAYIQNKPTNLTTQGNSFNGANELVQLDASGILPVLDGSQLTNLPLELPDQTANANKFLSTDGTNPNWTDIDGNVSPVVLKRDSTAGTAPTTADIALGEFFINSNDGKVYFKKDDGVAQIIAVSNEGHQHTMTDITGLVAALTLKIDNTEKGAANGLATLDANSKIPNNQLPPLAITETFTADNETNQLALTVQEGDVCVRTDISSTYIALNSNNSTMTDWQEIKTPTGGTLSVNGQTGTVVLDTDDINEGPTNLYFTNLRAINAIGATKDDNGNTPNDLWSANKIINYVNASVSTTGPYHDTVDPTSTDDASNHHFIGQVWVNTATDTKFICTDDTNSAAVWDIVGFSDGTSLGLGTAVYKGLNSNTLEFRSLVSGSSKLDIIENADNITLDVTINDSGTTTDDLWSANKIQSSIDSGVSSLTASNIGSENEVFKQLNGTDFEFRTLKANSSRLSIDDSTDNVVLDVEINDSGTTTDDLWSANKIQSSIDVLTPITTNVDPTANDDSSFGHYKGQLWQNNSYNTTYICNDDTAGAAVWERVDNQVLLKSSEPDANDDVTKGAYRGQLAYRPSFNLLYVCVDDTAGAAHWIKVPKTAKRANSVPTVNNWFYFGRTWIDTSTSKIYICTDDTYGAAVWDNLITEHNGLVSIDKPITRTDNNISSTDIDCSLGNFFYKNITADTTFTFSNVPSGYFEITVELTNAGSYAVDFTGTINYSGGAAPVYSNHTDVIRMYTRDGGTSWFAKLDLADAY